MTKVQLRYALKKPLDDELRKRISEAHRIYGILRILVQPGETEILVEYDASRHSVEKLENRLRSVGIPAERIIG